MDPLEVPFRRIINLARQLWLDSSIPEAREKLSLLLAWPEERAEHEERERAAQAERDMEERQATLRRTASTLGVDVESMYERAMRARSLHDAQVKENERQVAEKAKTT